MREAYVYVNVFNRGCQTLVAACDQEILGKTFREGKLRLEVSASFYKGSLMRVEDAVKILDEADVANLSGENIVHAALKKGLADPRAVIKVSGTPHLQFMKI
ncbi:MAG: DUF424 family protein [Candidatus Bathyarchaeia archaeon]